MNYRSHMDPGFVYDNYWSSGIHTDPHWSTERIFKEFAPLLELNSILDYGSGLISRKYGDVLAQKCPKYVGADISRFVVEKNQAEGFGCFEINPQTGTIDLPPGSFEGAICCEVFEHLYDPLGAAKEIHRLLKPGGKFISMVPNFGYHAWRLQALIRAQVPHEPENPAINKYNGVHIRYFSAHTFGELLQAAGFEKVSVQAYDFSSIWDVFRGLGRLAAVSDYARKKLPLAFHLSWLQRLWPDVFAMRLRAFAKKNEIP